MRTIREHKFNALMREVRAEFQRGQLYLATIDSDDEVLDGLCEPRNNNVYIDLAPSTVETVIHELLHRRYGDWSERRVSQTAHRLMTAMSLEERQSWFHEFLRAAVPIETVVRSSDE